MVYNVRNREMNKWFYFLANHKAQQNVIRVFSFQLTFRVLQAFYTSIHFTLYRSFVLFPAGRMNLKSKNKTYKKIIEEVCRKYEGAQEFIANKVKELCSQEGIFTEEVCTQFRANLFLLSISIKIVFCFEAYDLQRVKIARIF